MTEDIRCWFEQGEQFANQGSYRDALAQFDRVIALQPDQVSTWVFRAVTLIHLGEYEEALKSCDRALTLCPAEAEAWLFRGVALQRLDRYSEAYASYRSALGDRRSSPTKAPEKQEQSDLLALLRSSLTSLWQSFRRFA